MTSILLKKQMFDLVPVSNQQIHIHESSLLPRCKILEWDSVHTDYLVIMNMFLVQAV